jgi:hypothetical protein
MDTPPGDVPYSGAVARRSAAHLVLLALVVGNATRSCGL